MKSSAAAVVDIAVKTGLGPGTMTRLGWSTASYTSSCTEASAEVRVQRVAPESVTSPAATPLGKPAVPGAVGGSEHATATNDRHATTRPSRFMIPPARATSDGLAPGLKG